MALLLLGGQSHPQGEINITFRMLHGPFYHSLCVCVTFSLVLTGITYAQKKSIFGNTDKKIGHYDHLHKMIDEILPEKSLQATMNVEAQVSKTLLLNFRSQG